MAKRRGKPASPIHVRLFELRKAHDLTQEEVADAAGVDKTAVCHWETGDAKPDVERLPRLATLFETTVEALIEGDKQYEAIRNAFGVAS